MEAIKRIARTVLPRRGRRWLVERFKDLPYRWRDFAPDLREQLLGRAGGGLRLPPAALRRRVGLNSSREGFLAIGQGLSQALLSIFEQVRRPDEPYSQWLDFGCGSGRVARFLIEAQRGEIFGVDVDRPAVEWARRNLGPRFTATSPRPPLPFATASFDVVYAVSVFTHMDEELQFEWLRELHRILRPGGLLLASTHHPDLRWTRPDLKPEEQAQLDADGFLFAPGNGPFNENSTFHSFSYLEEAWGGIFDLHCYKVHGLNGYQDLSAWEARRTS